MHTQSAIVLCWTNGFTIVKIKQLLCRVLVTSVVTEQRMGAIDVFHYTSFPINWRSQAIGSTLVGTQNATAKFAAVPWIICLCYAFLGYISNYHGHKHLSAAVCTPPCQHGGLCVAPNICSCLGNWTGSQCEQRKSTSTNLNVCSI